MDVKDILGLSNQPSKAPQPKPAKQVRKSEGVSRELLSLTGGSLPSIVPTSNITATGLKEKQSKSTGKAVAWKWRGFTSTARTDGLTLHHWAKEDEKIKDYPFAKFNKKLKVPDMYSDEEYQLLLHDPEWSREETDFLFKKCCAYDLRFIVIADRYDFPDSNRTIEDIKERFYEIARKLLEHRFPDSDLENAFRNYIFNSEHERQRKAHLEKYFSKTKEQERIDAEVLAEAKRIQERMRSEDDGSRKRHRDVPSDADGDYLAPTKRKKKKSLVGMSKHEKRMRQRAASAPVGPAEDSHELEPEEAESDTLGDTLPFAASSPLPRPSSLPPLDGPSVPSVSSPMAADDQASTLSGAGFEPTRGPADALPSVSSAAVSSSSLPTPSLAPLPAEARPARQKRQASFRRVQVDESTDAESEAPEQQPTPAPIPSTRPPTSGPSHIGTGRRGRGGRARAEREAVAMSASSVAASTAGPSSPTAPSASHLDEGSPDLLAEAGPPGVTGDGVGTAPKAPFARSVLFNAAAGGQRWEKARTILEEMGIREPLPMATTATTALYSRLKEDTLRLFELRKNVEKKRQEIDAIVNKGKSRGSPVQRGGRPSAVPGPSLLSLDPSAAVSPRSMPKQKKKSAAPGAEPIVKRPSKKQQH